jgi:hypothetical protein
MAFVRLWEKPAREMRARGGTLRQQVMDACAREISRGEDARPCYP